jgi:hypothetical protein
MSQLQVNRINDASGGVLAPISSVMRNRIINGSMVLDQRNAGASITPTDNQYSLDRWRTASSQTGKYTVQQNAGSVTPPVGFTNYAGITSTSAYTVLTNDYFLFGQLIEGFNFADLQWGTANAKTVTLSFWVRSSLTGTFGGSLRNSASNRSYPFSYTINSANTWEYETITIAGDTSGTWVGATNGTGLNLQFSLGVGATFTTTAGAWAAGNFANATGATSVVGTNGATFYITGVQLEVGTQATSFEYRQYQQELALCQRYTQVFGGTAAYEEVGYGGAVSTTVVNTILALPVSMRVQPTSTQVGSFQVSDGATGFAASALGLIAQQSGTQQISLGITSSGLTALRAYRIETANSTASRLILSAEL